MNVRIERDAELFEPNRASWYAPIAQTELATSSASVEADGGTVVAGALGAMISIP